MNIEAARINMIKQQIRTCDVLDDHLLQIIQETPRETFVPLAYHDLAFADINIPLEHDQEMMTPMEEGIMLQALAIQPSDNILEIGTGTGYVTALLAKLGKHVETVDIFNDFTEKARAKLAKLQINNVTFITADVAQGLEHDQAYDVIAITGSLPFLPEHFRQNLKIGGRLFVVLGQSPAMRATLLTRESDMDWQQKELFETDLKTLIHAVQPSAFEF